MSLIMFTKVHIGSDKILLLKSNWKDNAFLPTDREEYFKNLLELCTPCRTPLTIPELPVVTWRAGSFFAASLGPWSLEVSSPWFPGTLHWARQLSVPFRISYCSLRNAVFETIHETIQMEKEMRIMGTTTRTDIQGIQYSASAR
jgi:hypothetical protein